MEEQRAPAACARPRSRLDHLALTLGLASLGGLALALWPGMGWPAWPATSLGAAALLLATPPGRALPRGLASMTGFVGVLLGGAQIAALWILALFTP